MTGPVVCARTILTPENALGEIDRVIRAALTHKQPVYIGIPGDFALMELGCASLTSVPGPCSDPETLVGVVDLLAARMRRARSPVILVGSLIGRYELREVAQRLIEKTGMPFTSMFMGKGTLSESHPNFIGVYNGRIQACDVREYVEGSDLVLSLGTVMSDINTGAFTTNI
ncbi:MAG: alpha-keto acid decarboxylase family protein, partial [Pseudodesulfovibrio sp.]